MTPLPIAEWQASLAEMETALVAMLAGLDRDTIAAGDVFAEASPAPARRELPPPGLSDLEARLGEYDARLTAAAELAESVERELTERAATVGRWREAFSRWQTLIQQH